MEKKFKLGFIGCGFMSSSIVRILLSSGAFRPSEIVMSDASEAAFEKVASLKVATTGNNAFVAENSDYLVLAVKPQSFPEVAASLRCGAERVLSIMAGVGKSAVHAAFPAKKVARCMPNTPCAIGQGVVAADVTEFPAEERAFLMGLLGRLGTAVEAEESLLNAVTGISGSGPAYVYLFADALIRAGVRQGLDEKIARLLAVGTIRGGAAMMEARRDESAESLTAAVCSKGGTTIEAVKVFREKGLYELVDEAVAACVRRAEELSGS